MKQTLIRIFTALALSVICLSAAAQAKIYTRKARLASFPTSTTKVIVGGGSFLDAALKEEIAMRWRVSPYEYGTMEEYEQKKNSSSYYFLRITQAEGLSYLTLSKGGKDNETDDLKKPFDVVSVPIASLDDPTGKEIIFMGAFIDIIQNFVEEAMINDRAGYGGLKYYDGRNLEGRQVYLDSGDVDQHYAYSTSGALLGIVVAPSEETSGPHCYKMLISADTHELFYYDKCRFKAAKDAAFTSGDIKQITKRNGVVSR